ncbi:helicase associated domain-containing protein [Streptomyces sp. NRRL S-1824]|uniref:helicase associated domain-containing protein n=1 Tax=Streptomyces sp. NRRL S-1824 TaxID=1463889 RepID=UPI00068CAF43|nr:helicase associated domain-containing protein [Streptomyces sp. NRRL S-1824]
MCDPVHETIPAGAGSRKATGAQPSGNREHPRRCGEQDTADTAFAENLAAARAYYAQAGTLAAPRHATALDKPVGQWLTNLRRPGGLGKDPERAARRADQLAAIDPDWNPGQLGWTVDWQRHWASLSVLLAGVPASRRWCPA